MSWREDVAIDAELAREQYQMNLPSFDVEAIGADPHEPGRFAWIATTASLELADAVAAAHTARTGHPTRVA